MLGSRRLQATMFPYKYANYDFSRVGETFAAMKRVRHWYSHLNNNTLH